MIKRVVKGGNIIHISKIHPIIRWAIRVPRKYQTEIIKELTNLHLLRKIDRDNYEILSCRHESPIDSLGEPLWS